MQLEQANAILRPRNSWEAMDLGFQMARRWFAPLWLLWMATALPVFVIVHLIFPDSLVLAVFIAWWLKPLYEPLLTEWLGRALFNEKTSVRDQLKRAWPVLRKGLIGNLTWRRFFPSRSFFLCVQQLEGLSGNRYSKRMNVLSNTNPNSGWLTILMVHMEAVLAISIHLLIVMMLPQTVDIDITSLEYLESSLFYAWFGNIVYLLVASLIAPFYVAAGFSLYINSRTELEAWDIEIAFRQMAAKKEQRTRGGALSKAASLILLAVVSVASLGSPNDTLALEREEARTNIKEVLAHKDFGEKKTVSRWELIKDDKNDELDMDFSLSGLEWLGTILKIVGLGLIILIAGFLILKIVENIGDSSLYRKQKTEKARPTHRLLESEEDDEPIPENPVEAVMRLCEQGELRKAMSLLYRATLLHYITRQQIDIPESATEGECLVLVREYRPTEESGYFQQLTRNWQWLAYAGEPLPSARIQELCKQWPDIYSEVADAT